MKDSMRLETIVRVLAHEYLCLTELHVSLGKCHGNGLILHATNLLRPRNALFLGVQRPTGRQFLVLFAFFQHKVDQADAQLLRLVTFHTPRQLLVGCRRQEHTIALIKGLVIHAHGVARSRHAHGFQDTTVAQLFRRALARQQQRLGRIVRFDATNVMRVRLLDILNQRLQLLLELLADRLGLGRLGFAIVRWRASQILALLEGIGIANELARRRFKQGLGRQWNLVLVLFHKVRLGRVLHQTGKVTHTKDCLGLLHIGRLEAGILRHGLVLVGNVLLVHALGPIAIATLGQATLVIEHGQDTNLGRLNGIETVLIVGKLDKGPLNVLGFVLGLLELENELVELLLQSLIGVVDTELFKRVDGKALETKDIQDTT